MCRPTENIKIVDTVLVAPTATGFPIILYHRYDSCNYGEVFVACRTPQPLRATPRVPRRNVSIMPQHLCALYLDCILGHVTMIESSSRDALCHTISLSLSCGQAVGLWYWTTKNIMCAQFVTLDNLNNDWTAKNIICARFVTLGNLNNDDVKSFQFVATVSHME